MRGSRLWRSDSLSVLFSGTGLDLYLPEAILVWLRTAARVRKTLPRSALPQPCRRSSTVRRLQTETGAVTVVGTFPSVELPLKSMHIPIWSKAGFKPLQGKQFTLHRFILCDGELKSITEHILLGPLLLSFSSVVEGNSPWLSVLLLTRVIVWPRNTNIKLRLLSFKCCSSASYTSCSVF